MGKPRDCDSGLTHQDGVALLRYDPLTGKFFWRKKRNQATGEAGSVNPSTGYRLIMVCGVRVMAHRLAWFYVHGRWPDGRIDHKNCKRDDQAFTNLREATDSQNKANSIARADNALGIKGVRMHESGRYQSRIWDGERNHHLGLFDTLAEAKSAYDRKAAEMFGEFARAA